MSDVIDKVREKYPQYKDVSDDELTVKLGTKYPSYLDSHPEFKADFTRLTTRTATNAPVKSVTETTPKVPAKDMPDTPTATGFRPAIRLVGGEVVVGDAGTTHPDIIQANDLRATDIDQRGFVDKSGAFHDREQTAVKTGLPTNMEAGRQHSKDLPEAAAAGIKGATDATQAVMRTIGSPAAGEASEAGREQGAAIRRQQEASLGGVGPETTLGAAPETVKAVDPLFGQGVKLPDAAETERIVAQAIEHSKGMDVPVVPLGDWIIKAKGEAKTKTEEGINESLRGTLNGLTTPANLALMGASMGVATTGKVAARLVSAIWAAFMGKGTVEDAVKLKEELSKPNPDTKEVARLLTSTGTSAAFTGLAGAHAAGVVGDIREAGSKAAIERTQRAFTEGAANAADIMGIAKAGAPLTAKALADVSTLKPKEPEPVVLSASEAVEPKPTVEPQPSVVSTAPLVGKEIPVKPNETTTAPASTESGAAAEPTVISNIKTLTPAIRGGEKPITGRAHAEVRDKITASKDPDAILAAMDHTNEGFVDQDGNFVSRQDAYKWFKAQFPDYKVKLEDEQKLSSEDLKAKGLLNHLEPKPAEDKPLSDAFEKHHGRAPTAEELAQVKSGQIELPQSEVAEPPPAPETKPDTERAAKVARIKEITALTQSLSDKGGLTRDEATKFRALMAEANSLRHDVAKPLTLDKIPSPEERQSTLPSEIVLTARNDLMRDKNIYAPIVDAATGVSHNADTAVDDVMTGKNPTVSPQQFYDAFNATREALRKQFGDTITIFRAEGKQRAKPTQNWATTEQYAKQFGDKIISKEVPIDNVLAVNVGPSGKYHEIIVGEPPKKPTTTSASVEGVKEATPNSTTKAVSKVKQHLADLTPPNAKEVKSQLVGRLEKAIGEAPSISDLPGDVQSAVRRAQEIMTQRPPSRIKNENDRANWSRGQGNRAKEDMNIALQAGLQQITIDIPGDGTFTVWNSKEHISELLSRAKHLSTSPSETGKGFSESKPTKQQGKESIKEAEALAKEGQPSVTEISTGNQAEVTGGPGAGEGPGATTYGPGGIDPKAPIQSLEESFRNIDGKKVPLSEKVKEAFKAGNTLSAAKEAISGALAGLKSSGDYLIQKWKGVPKLDDLLRAKGQLSAELEKRGWRVRQFEKTVLKTMPDVKQRSAIRKWVDAGGDAADLRRGLSETPAEYKQAYRDALALKGDELIAAMNIQNYFEARLDEAIDAGVLQQGVEDYIHRIYEKDPSKASKALAYVQSGILKENPALTKKRVFQWDWEAEKLGYKPVQDFLPAITQYESSLSRAIAARQFIKTVVGDGKSIKGLKASDGRPVIDVAGLGIPIEDPSGIREGTLIKPSFKPGDETDPLNNRKDYKTRDYPALQKWRWTTLDAGGKPIYVQGDLLIHPDYVSRVDSLLKPSAIRYAESPTARAVGRGALALSNTVKQTMLDLSGFHQVQITVHGMEHKVMPWKIDQEIDFENPNVDGLLKGGLTVGGEYHARYASEGLFGRALTRHIPILGPLAETYHNWLFQDYIPRIKATMALNALERNKARYARKMTDEQIFQKTASEANSAFGELNYIMLERSKTAQDISRLIMLAPDFLEARGRFAGGALEKGGKGFGNEQRAALVLGALTMYVTARALNKMTDDQYHFEPENAFSWVHNGKAYGLRTVQGDILHLIEQPAQFWLHRLNPVYTRPLLEAATGRDYFGRKRNTMQQAWDAVSTAMPISLRSSRERSIWESMANSFGVTARRYSDVDTAFKLSQAWKDKHGKGQRGEFIYDPEKDPLRSLKIALSNQDDSGSVKEVKKLIDSKEYTKEKLDSYFSRYANMTFTGSKASDAKWKASLTDDQKKTVQAAREHKQQIRRLYQQAEAKLSSSTNAPSTDWDAIYR